MMSGYNEIWTTGALCLATLWLELYLDIFLSDFKIAFYSFILILLLSIVDAAFYLVVLDKRFEGLLVLFVLFCWWFKDFILILY